MGFIAELPALGYKVYNVVKGVYAKVAKNSEVGFKDIDKKCFRNI